MALTHGWPVEVSPDHQVFPGAPQLGQLPAPLPALEVGVAPGRHVLAEEVAAVAQAQELGGAGVVVQQGRRPGGPTFSCN